MGKKPRGPTKENEFGLTDSKSRLNAFSKILALCGTPEIPFVRVPEGSIEEHVILLQDLLDKCPLVPMAVGYSLTPVDNNALRGQLLSVMIPEEIQQSNFKILNTFDKAFVEAKELISTGCKPQNPLFNKVQEYWDIFQVVYEGDLIYAADLVGEIKDPRFHGKSIQEIRELIRTVNPPYDQGNGIVYESIHRNPDRRDIIQRRVVHEEWERLENHITVESNTDVESWRWGAADWLVQMCHLFEDYPEIQRYLFKGSGWERKKTEHVTVLHFGDAEVTFPMDGYGMTEPLFRKIRSLYDQMIQNQEDAGSEFIVNLLRNNEKKGLAFFQNNVDFKLGSSGNSGDSQKDFIKKYFDLIRASILHNMIMECPEEVIAKFAWFKEYLRNRRARFLQDRERGTKHAQSLDILPGA